MAANSPTKAQLQETLNDVGERIADLLDPSLTRKQIVDQIKEIDELVNGVDIEEEEAADEDADDDDADDDDDEDEDE